MTISVFSEKFNSAFNRHIGVNLSEMQVSQFFDFMNLLIEKNKVMNLTAITEPDEIVIRHFVDSCSPIAFHDIICANSENANANNINVLPTPINSNDDNDVSQNQGGAALKDSVSNFFANKKIVDIGTGAGFPGIPLAIICPNAEFTLTDTLGKRVNFLAEVVDKIGLQNTRLVKSRAEDFCHDFKYRESFDFAVARGVAKLSVLSEYLLPALKIGGKMISYKMKDVDEELNESKSAIKILGGKIYNFNGDKLSYGLIDGEPLRALIIINKISKTPKQYPRKAGTPAKNPL